ncbi:precorrin-2 dehydrogenase/sirohydrochlorin ferrochelatase family protein [Paenibacillus sp. KN14-4R]|uniref:precorrin-2 dehydrogenase/sirohydrochlorin ferrochelatase family protein n=1 Tax=Paenibacillus sp. KN14-4R TaxID=3445773 RepID=UPI003FA0763A
MGYQYPVMMNLANKICLVIGGGRIAERKVRGLLEAGAVIHLMTPAVTDGLKQLIDAGALLWINGRYTQKIFQGNRYLLVFTATSDQAVNEQAAMDAGDHGALVCRVDHYEQGDFIVPAAVKRGDLHITVSTGGGSPALAAMLKRQLEQSYGQEYEAYLDFLQELRVKLKEWVEDRALRQEMLRLVLDFDLLPLIRRGEQYWLPLRERIWIEIEQQPSVVTMTRLNNWIQIWEERFDAQDSCGN